MREAVFSSKLLPRRIALLESEKFDLERDVQVEKIQFFLFLFFSLFLFISFVLFFVLLFALFWFCFLPLNSPGQGRQHQRAEHCCERSEGEVREADPEEGFQV